MKIIDLRGDPNAFRTALRTWLAETLPPNWQREMSGASDGAFKKFQEWWLGELREQGLATPHWPTAWGGQALDIPEQIIVFEEMARADAPDPVMFMVSMFHLPATLAKWGTQEQIDRYLPGARAGEVWAQGFSEPNAGSDLASLRTRAVREGNTYVINGQKVWSSYAIFADYYLLLARTDPDAPKHQGISCFIVDLKSPGVDVRPIRQLNGQDEFCEVFLDDVVVPAENLIGPENRGWEVAQTTLSAERGLLIFSYGERMNGLFQRLFAKATASRWPSDAALRREMMTCYADFQSVRGMVRKMLMDLSHGKSDLPPIIKILYGETLQRFAELWTRIEGMDSLIERPNFVAGTYAKENWMMDYLTSWVWTISGGSNEILRNVIAERQLGLPREPKPA